MDDHQLLRYSRHILLNEIGIEAQQRFLDSHVLIIGAGGLGSPAAIYLATAGIGKLTIADADTVDLTNLQRQIIHSQQFIGQSKVLSAQHTLKQLNPDIKIDPLPHQVDQALLKALLTTVDVVLDCSDNFKTRRLVNQLCYQFRVPLISGAAIRFDGQVTCFDFQNPLSPCYHCLFPQHPEETQEACATMGVFSPLVGIVGSIQAAQALQLIGQFGKPLIGRLLSINGLNTTFQSFEIQRDPHCAICGQSK